MENLESLEKAINSELTTKILSSKIKHDQINICIEDNNLSEVMIFLKTHTSTKFKQLIDITAVDYPERDKRFKMVYLLLSHEKNSRIKIEFDMKEGQNFIFFNFDISFSQLDGERSFRYVWCRI